MSQRIIPQPALSRALQRRLSMPAIGHDFDVVSDPPPAKRVDKVEDEKSAIPSQRPE